MCRIMEEVAEEGFRKGFRKGFEKGYKEGVEKTALRMLESGEFSPEEVAEITESVLAKMEDELQESMQSVERPWNRIGD